MCSRTQKNKKTSASQIKTSKSLHQTITIYAQNVFLNNSFINSIKGDFDVAKTSHNGDLQKTAAKTPVRNVAFEKHNDKFRIMETKNPKICDPENVAVYDLNTRNCDPEFGGKYRQFQKISEYCTVLSDDFHVVSADSVDREQFNGNLVLNNIGWPMENAAKIQISSANNNKTVYTTLDNSRYNLTEVTLTMANKTYKIYTPKIMMKLCEMDKTSRNSSILKTQSFKPKDLSCSHHVFTFKQYSKRVQQSATDESLTSVARLTSNVNRSAETVVESTKNDWKNSDRRRAYADKVFLSKIKKNKGILKYQAMTCY